MKLLIVIATCLLGATLLAASPLKQSKPRALVTSRADVVAPEETKDKPQYMIRVMPKDEELEELSKLVDFFAHGETGSPSASTGSPHTTSYGSYSPSRDDLTEPLLPPPVEQSEPNYYAIKPKKSKGKKYIPSQKLINLKNPDTAEKDAEGEKVAAAGKAARSEEDTFFLDAIDLDKLLASALLGEQDAQSEASARSLLPLRLEELNRGEFVPSRNRRVDQYTRRVAGEDEGARIDFQMHGHHGPNSYKFGYDTGEGKNRQFHVEERDSKGNVRGRYGYYMRSGKFRIVNYSSSPETGFRIEP
ncbi:uncharacterized protein LOC5668109 isoform X1 [Anopheles gambiae]|uniref:Uncharacterized protein n=2 Tax=gambiae species complex TaxID=44542 RepID=A0ABK8FRN9_ANOGA|nr:uncharacterized protein LOC120958670 isoform X1 [Anopheles coluzzii]XP_061510818.1 uncharacterized protein LOC5668109 isoform X1 [Anopheles gambiae]